MERVLITGASGLIGSELSRSLSHKEFEVIHLSRSKSQNKYKTFVWDIRNGIIDKGALENIDCIIHLAGAGIADKRWTSTRKQEIIDSRVKSADLLFNEIAKLDKRPRAFISASAIGYYGAKTSEHIFTESDPPGNDFQGQVCTLWEKSSKRVEELGLRTAQLRFGVVLAKDGGALKKMLLPAKLGIGSALGTGQQFLPWVHIKDVINIIEKIITEEKLQGAYNIVSPTYTTYEEFAKTLAKVLNRPSFMPNVPSILLKLLMGEMSEIVLESSRISPQKIIDSGYQFQFTDLHRALADLLKK